MISGRHQLRHRMEIPPIPDLPARAATVCQCGEVVKPQRSETVWIFYCTNCGWEHSEPAPRPRWPRTVQAAQKRCRCDKVCRFCKGRR